MNRQEFDQLRIIRREHMGDVGCSEVCVTPLGVSYIKLSIQDSICQREYLESCAKANAHVTQGSLAILLPHRKGISLKQWLTQAPSLAQRREACLSLVAQCLQAEVPPCVITLSACSENLQFQGETAWLQLLPDWSHWSAQVPTSRAVMSVAVLCRDMLCMGFSSLQRTRFPVQLKLLLAKLSVQEYHSWGQLQRDLSAIPDALEPLAPKQTLWIKLVGRVIQKYSKPALCVVVALLVVAALLTLIGVYQSWDNASKNKWPGISIIGNQELHAEGESYA